MRRPELELDVARRAQPREIVVAARIQVDSRNRLRVTPVQALGETDNRGQRLDRPAPRPVEVAVAVVRLLGRGLPMISGNECDDLDFLGIETSQIAVLDEVIRVAVVTFVADMHADIVEQRAELEQVALFLAECVHGARLIEDRQRQPRDLLRVLGPVAAALAQLDDAAPADVRVALDLANPRAVAMDVVEDEPFAQRQVAEGEFVGA